MNGHRGKPWRKRQPSHDLAPLGNYIVCIQCAKFLKQRPCFRQCNCRRLIHKGKIHWVADAPMRQIERQSGEVAGQDLRWGKGGQGGRLARMPKSYCNAGFGSSCSTGALFGGSL
ncbi:hypothetical protein D3C80_1599710 [compost metagenome]